MQRRATITVRAVLPLLAAARGAGVDASALLREHGIDGGILFDSDARLPHDVTTSLWTRAVAASRDPDLALRVLELVDVRLLGARPDASDYLMVQIFAASATVGDALGRLARSYPIVDDGVRLELTHDHGRLHVRYVPMVDAALPPAFVLFQLGVWARMMSGCAATSLTSIALDLRAARAGDLAEHRRVLCADVRFGAREDALSIAADEAAIAMRGANAATLATLEQRAEAALVERSPAHALAESVRAMIAQRLVGGNPSAEAIAAELRMSSRTLARRLDAIGTSHRAIADEVRAELAERWLRGETARIDDVARRLGFSDASAFHRAFKRWFGQAPSDFVRKRATPA